MSRFLSRFNIETWRDIDGYAGLYQVSNLGRVRSVPRKTYCGPVYGYRRNRGRVLHLHTRINGYTFLTICKNGKPKSFDVHRFVAKAFCHVTPGAYEVDHIDRDKQNNRAYNLRWVHSSDNKYNSCRRDSAASRFNGVKLSHKKWRATVRVGKKIVCIGTFKDEISAARAFDSYCKVNKLNRRLNNV